MKSGIPEAAGALHVVRACASGLQAILSAGQQVESGHSRLALAGGAECYSRAPHAVTKARWGVGRGSMELEDMLDWAYRCPFSQDYMGETAENLAKEVHDATSFYEIFQLEMLGFAEDGEGGKLIESGATKLRGLLPVNLSGGLVSKGHPVGATGLSMIHELTLQLRTEAGKRQAEKPRIALAENGGGVIGFDEAACSAILLEGRGVD